MHGFGYPVFGFYAPLSSWFLEVLHLIGLDFAPATRLAFAASLLAAYPFQLGGAGYPSTAWAASSLVRDQLIWRLPASLSTGTYVLQTGVEAGSPIRLGSVVINAPDRNFTPPPIALAVPAQIGFARLLGLTRVVGPATAGQTVTVELAWQSSADTPTSYRVYVHLRDAAGNIHAQSDSVPAGWTRPTTGWLPGEYVLDARRPCP
jgi:hypothetical protein